MKMHLSNTKTFAETSGAKCGLLIALGAALLMLVGCATEVTNHTFIGQSYPPKPASATVDVYTNGIPERPFDRVAILDAHCESQGWMVPNLEHDAIPALIKAGRAAGCDAIIELKEVKPPENWTFETKVKHFTGVGIRYK